METLKSLFGSTKVWTWVISQFGGLAIIYVASKLGVPADSLADLTLVLLGKAGVETSALLAARSYVDAQTSSAKILADGANAPRPPVGALVGATAEVQPPSP